MNQKIQLWVAVVILFSVLGAAHLWAYYQDPEPTDYFGEVVAEPRSYEGRIRKMTELVPELNGERIELPFHKIDRHDIVYFEIENENGFAVPVMAYITPTGRLFVGVSLCEGCGGRRYALAGDTLLSENCRTIFKIEDHRFIRGSRRCRDYPPQLLDWSLEEDTLVIPREEVLGWQPRVGEQK